MVIHIESPLWPVDNRLRQLLQDEIAKSPVGGGGAVLNFRDPGYSAEKGGFHPVEIAVAADGCIRYISDFAYYGAGQYAELAKEIDFDFSLGLFQHMGREFPIRRGKDLFELWQENFISYHQMAVYAVEVTEG